MIAQIGKICTSIYIINIAEFVSKGAVSESLNLNLLSLLSFLSPSFNLFNKMFESLACFRGGEFALANYSQGNLHWRTIHRGICTG